MRHNVKASFWLGQLGIPAARSAAGTSYHLDNYGRGYHRFYVLSIKKCLTYLINFITLPH
jgi:hypothetical protein